MLTLTLMTLFNLWLSLFFQRHFRGGGILQQDGARPHTARLTMNFLAQNGINVLDWQAMPPDMSHIEHVWDDLKRRVYACPHSPVH